MSIAHRSALRAGCVIMLMIASLAIQDPAAGRPLAQGSPRTDTSASTCAASTVTLYDARLGETPDIQGMDYQAYNKQTIVVSATQTFSDGVTLLDTMPRRGDAAGYFGKTALVPALDRTVGYTLTFGVQVLAEEHSNADRAGLSLIALSSDTRGIELGFWADHIWAQEDGAAEPPAGTLFTHAEDTPFATTAGLISYTLTMRGDSYSLAADGTPILTGALRDYTAFNGFPDVYETPNFIFVGDDTSSARARIRLAALAVSIPQCTDQQFLQYLPIVIAAP